MNCATCGMEIGGLWGHTPKKDALDKAKERGFIFREPICNGCFNATLEGKKNIIENQVGESEDTSKAYVEHSDYCITCGLKLPEAAAFCPKCGKQRGQNRGSVAYVERQVDEPNFGFALLSFLIPIVGLILWAMWSDKYPLKAKSCGKGALFGFIAGCLFALFISFPTVGAPAKKKEEVMQEFYQKMDNMQRESDRNWQNYQHQKRLRELESERRYLKRKSF